MQFTVHSDLGRVVQAIIREFERRPPPLVGDAGGGTSTTHHTGENGRATSSIFIAYSELI